MGRIPPKFLRKSFDPKRPLIKLSVLTTDEHLLAGGDVVVDFHLELICGDLEHNVVTLLQPIESSKCGLLFVQDDLVFIAVGMDNPLAFFACLDHH